MPEGVSYGLCHRYRREQDIIYPDVPLSRATLAIYVFVEVRRKNLITSRTVRESILLYLEGIKRYSLEK
jgi:hypothetical protein